MPSLLFATSFEPHRIERGTFSCPHCLVARLYVRVRVQKTVTIVGVHLPIGREGEYIECGECLSTYRPEVLAYDAGADRPRVLAEYQRALKRVLALLVITDGQIHDDEVETLQCVFHAVCGEELSRGEVVEEAHAVSREPMTAARYLAQVIGYLNDYGKEQVLRGAAMVSHADGSLHEREANMVRRLAGVMRLDPARTEAVLRVVG